MQKADQYDVDTIITNGLGEHYFNSGRRLHLSFRSDCQRSKYFCKVNKQKLC